MRRVLILGPGGAGKSTFAARLADRTGLPLIHLDQKYWQPGWKPPDEGWWREKVRELSARERWIMDGNYGATFDLRMPRADTILVFEPRPLKNIWRAFLRVAKTYGRVRADMAPGCPERFDLAFFKWIWDFPQETKPRIEEGLRLYGAGKRVERFRTDRDATRFLEQPTAIAETV